MRPRAASATTFLGRGMNREATRGTTITATTSEASRATTTVIAKGLKKSPAMPLRNTMGRKTATVVRVEAVTAPRISREADSAAVTGCSPSRTWRVTFSRTTIESSTTRPIATIIAPSVRMLSVIPAAQRTSSAASRLVGIEIAATRVARTLRRNKKITRIANSAPRRPSRRMEAIAFVIGVAWSSMTLKVTSPPMLLRMEGIAPRTSFATLTVFAVGVGRISREMLGLPLVRVSVPSLMESSWTEASSESGTVDVTGIVSICCRLVSEPDTWTGIEVPLSSTLPTDCTSEAC